MNFVMQKRSHFQRQRRNLPFKITSDEMYDVFGKYGAIRQIRM